VGLRDERATQTLATPSFVEHTFARALAGTFPDAFVPSGLRFVMGAGDVAPDGWICLDTATEYLGFENRARDVLDAGEGKCFADITRLDWIPDGCAAVVYSHHVLEHVPISAWDRTLRHWTRILRPGGLLYTCVPDLLAVCAAILEGAEPGSAETYYRRHPWRRALGSWRPRLAPTGSQRETAWGCLYLDGDHLSVPTEAQYRAAVEPLGLEVRRYYNDLAACNDESRRLASLEGKYLGRKVAE